MELRQVNGRVYTAQGSLHDLISTHGIKRVCRTEQFRIGYAVLSAAPSPCSEVL